MATREEIRALAESDLLFFAQLINPHRVYGDIHKDVFRWWMDLEKEGANHSLLLLPRDHQKSHCAAVKAAWLITRDPATTILYVSATAELAVKQLRAIKQILTSDIYTRYWPEMLNSEEGKREKWTETQICVDHPKRREEGVRDDTILACGITKTITGLHVQHVFLDDLVVPSNAYTEDGRQKVRELYSQLASIETTGATETVVGTRYHPSDIYTDLIDMKESAFNDEGELIGESHVYTTKIEVVERDGVFLWPKEYRPDGKVFGFDAKELARKKAKYLDSRQFYAQYYQEPNDPESHRVRADQFQYYDQKHIKYKDGQWWFRDKMLNVYAAIDFAFSLNRGADYTAIVVIGIDKDGFIYVLDIERFKTDKINDYYERIVALHSKWEFKRLRAEVTVAQAIIVRDLKDKMRVSGLRLVVEEFRPLKKLGSKEERMAAVLEPRYMDGSIFHYRGGYTPVLEEEVVLARPAHDDVKDALTCAIEIAVPPKQHTAKRMQSNVVYHSRFGGIS